MQQVSQYKWFSILDLRSAYHQVPLLKQERKYTAFEANGRLYQFKRVPFGLENADLSFQRVVNQIISKINCKGTLAHLDDITVSGHTREELGKNLKTFLKAAEECNITLNEKNVFMLPIPSNCWGIKSLMGAYNLTLTELH